MSSGGNLLQMVFDGIWSTGEMIFKSFRKKEEEKAPSAEICGYGSDFGSAALIGIYFSFGCRFGIYAQRP